VEYLDQGTHLPVIIRAECWPTGGCRPDAQLLDSYANKSPDTLPTLYAGVKCVPSGPFASSETLDLNFQLAPGRTYGFDLLSEIVTR
jgi:hypothetical protein